MAKLIGQQLFHGFRFAGRRHDCGDAVGFVTGNIAMALDRPDLAPKVREFIAGL
jgi:UTP--glucose-1-phosphate uridylyltransferase